MPTSVRRRLAAWALVLALPALGACSSFDYQTNQVYQPAVGVNDRSGTVDVLGAVIVSVTEGQGTFVTTLVSKSADKADTLVSVTGDKVQAKVAAPVEVPAGQLVNLADQGAVSVDGDRVAEGNWVRLELTFESGQKTELNVPVVRREAEFADVKLASPSSSASPSTSPSP